MSTSWYLSPRPADSDPRDLRRNEVHCASVWSTPERICHRPRHRTLATVPEEKPREPIKGCGALLGWAWIELNYRPHAYQAWY
jgi:hypothetical protein